jgi:hypothetical protein
MRKCYSFTLLFITLITLTNCKNGEDKKEYFIISKDSICIATERYKNNDLSDQRFTLIAPPPLPGFEWYSNLVIIFDSTDRVYLYQTKQTENLNSTIKCEERIGLSKYPPFIGLQPFHLLTFKSEDFINFLRNNNDILNLDSSNETRNRSFVYIVSNKDTIENKAYYQFIKLIRPKSELRRKSWPVCYMIRMTTEEENVAIYYKRKGETHLPYDVKWSENFIEGKCRPSTEKYDSIEKKMFYVIKASSTFGLECTKLPRVL